MEGYWIIFRHTNRTTSPRAKRVKDNEEAEQFIQDVGNIEIIDITESIYKE